MKKIALTFIAIMLGLVVFAQGTAENYKLGDFHKSQVKAKTIKLGNDWLIQKNATSDALEFKVGSSTLGSLSTAGAFTTTSSVVPTMYATTISTSTIGSNWLSTDSLNDLRWFEATLDSADIEGMYATPVTVVPAQAGYVYTVVDAIMIYDGMGTGYTRGAGVYLEYTGSTDLTDTIACTNGPRATGDKIYRFPILNPAGGQSLPVNTAIAVTNAIRAYVGGTHVDGTLTVKILCRRIAHDL